MALLEVRGLQVSYGPIQAVRGIDLDVEQGQIVALLGANGAGKTTTLRAISGVVRPTAGTITENGQPLGKRACKVARQGISMSSRWRRTCGREPIFSGTRGVSTRICGGSMTCSPY